MRYLFSREAYAEPVDCMVFPMNVEDQESPTRLLIREVPTSQIRFDLAVPDFYSGSIWSFVDVFVEAIGGRNGATDPDVNSGVVLRAEPWGLYGATHWLVIRNPFCATTQASYGIRYSWKPSTSTVSSLRRLGAHWRMRRRPCRETSDLSHRMGRASSVSLPYAREQAPFLARYYSARNAIVIVSGVRCVFNCNATEYLRMRDASSPKLNNVEERRIPAKDSVCVNIFRDIP